MADENEIINFMAPNEGMYARILMDYIRLQRIKLLNIMRPDQIVYSSFFLDLGTGAGSFTSMLAHLAREMNGKVYSIDILQKTTDMIMGTIDKIKRFNLDNYVEFLTYDDRSPDCIKYLKKNMYAVILIDTSHTYDHTLFELREYSNMLLNGGAFILHDTKDGNVARAINDFIKEDSRFIITGNFVTGDAGMMILERIV